MNKPPQWVVPSSSKIKTRLTVRSLTPADVHGNAAILLNWTSTTAVLMSYDLAVSHRKNMRRLLMFRRLSNTPRHRKTGRFNIRLIHVSGNRATHVVCDGRRARIPLRLGTRYMLQPWMICFVVVKRSRAGGRTDPAIQLRPII